jgi:hypothetical protein
MLPQFDTLRGTVARDFSTSGFLHESTPYGTLINILIFFDFVIKLSKMFEKVRGVGVSETALYNKISS